MVFMDLRIDIAQWCSQWCSFNIMDSGFIAAFIQTLFYKQLHNRRAAHSSNIFRNEIFFNTLVWCFVKDFIVVVETTLIRTSARCNQMVRRQCRTTDEDCRCGRKFWTLYICYWIKVFLILLVAGSFSDLFIYIYIFRKSFRTFYVSLYI